MKSFATLTFYQNKALTWVNLTLVSNIFLGYELSKKTLEITLLCNYASLPFYIGVRPSLVSKSIHRLKVRMPFALKIRMPFAYSLVSNIFLDLNMKEGLKRIILSCTFASLNWCVLLGLFKDCFFE